MNRTDRVATMTRLRRPRTILLAVLALAIVGVVLYTYSVLRGDGGPRLRTEDSVAAPSHPDALPELVLLAPGTTLEPSPPKGWSDPVVKTVTHLESGDINTLPAFARKTATRFRTAILADVRREEGQSRFRLRRVGAGLCLDLDGRETVISSDSLKEQKVDLGTVDAMVLGRAERALGRSRLVARTPAFAVYDTYVELADAAGVHHSILLRYALLVDPETGALRTVCWSTPDDPSERRPVESWTLLPPNYVFRCGIHIAAKRVIGNLAAAWYFAMVDLPRGESIPVPEGLRSLASGDLSDEDGPALERALREALGGHAADARK